MPFNGTDNPNLKRPAPSSGFSDFPRLLSHASSGGINNAPPGPRVGVPSKQSSVFNLAANPNATYPLFCGAFSNNWQQQYSEGMILFINMQHTPNKSRDNITGRHNSHNILASIPVLNFYLTIGSSEETYVQRYVRRYQLNEALIPRYPSDTELADRLKDDGMTSATDEQKAYVKDVMFIEDFNKKWRYMGVVLTDMDLSSRYQKLFNLNVRGRTRVFNMWSTRKNGLYERKTARDRVQKNDHLYLVLKKCPKDETTYMQPDGSTMAIIPPPNESNLVWQIKTERTTHGQAPFAERIYDRADSDIIKLLPEPKLHIEVGKVINAISKKPDEHFQRRSFREHTQMASLPMIEVALHTGQL